MRRTLAISSRGRAPHYPRARDAGARLLSYNEGMKLQFRLRTLFVAVTVTAVACAWLGHEYHVVQERKAMRAWISAVGSQASATFSNVAASIGGAS
jgi:hypothetical protein